MTELENKLADALLKKALDTVEGRVASELGYAFPTIYESLCRAAQIRNEIELTKKS